MSAVDEAREALLLAWAADHWRPEKYDAAIDALIAAVRAETLAAIRASLTSGYTTADGTFCIRAETLRAVFTVLDVSEWSRLNGEPLFNDDTIAALEVWRQEADAIVAAYRAALEQKP